MGKKRKTPDAASASSDEGSSDESESKPLAAFTAPARPYPSAVTTLAKPSFGDDEKHMWFQTTQVGHMATLFKCLSKLLPSSASVVFAPGGFRIVSMNSKKTALLYLRITEQTMEEGLYDCNFSYRVSLPVDEVASRIRMFRRTEVMSLTLRGQRPDTIRMDFCVGHRNTDIELRLRQPDDVHLEIPKQVYHTQVDLPAEEFREVISSVKSDNLITDITFTKHPRKFTITVSTINGKINTHFTADNSPDSVKFYCSGEGADEPTEEQTTDDEAPHETLRATFPIAEMIALTEVTRAAKWVNINMPEPNGAQVLKISYSLAALGELSFYLSQKLDAAED